MQRALAEVVLLGVAGGALGCWVVFYGFSYAAESLAHSLFPGLVLAAIAGARCCSARPPRSSLPPPRSHWPPGSPESVATPRSPWW